MKIKQFFTLKGKNEMKTKQLFIMSLAALIYAMAFTSIQAQTTPKMKMTDAANAGAITVKTI